ncbi:MAG: ABC transporter ATP-binding protein [Moraxellaceae bacterium]|jgi:putative ABC transport system ATP-binding protein|nr:ABC transporter ATP-binding protein [Moraxellaceae bacterium]HQV40627.1 ABC transporter ATP-binding protein [Moraxellaceae bacterium]HQX89122.1 ABC transporter ATP-binding protein [Moraxellaceae bacterium]
MSSEVLIAAQNISKTVRTGTDVLTILNGITLTIHKGERIAIIGASGSGKTTLLGLMAGLDRPDTGSLSLCGQALDNLNEDQRAELRKQHVGFVFQSFLLVPTLTALENVMLALSVNHRGDTVTAREWLERVGLGHRLHHTPRQLSGGEQQRVALARAFAGRPSILFADEPTGNLDAKTGAQINELLFSLNAEAGTTLVLVTHEQLLADQCDRTIRLDNGRIVRDDT